MKNRPISSKINAFSLKLLEFFFRPEADKNHNHGPNCDCQGADRFLTITMSKATHLKSLKLRTRNSLLSDGKNYCVPNIETS